MDYRESIATYWIGRFPGIDCFTVQTVADNDFEPQEYFTVNIETRETPRIIIQPSSLRFNIIDDDGKYGIS